MKKKPTGNIEIPETLPPLELHELRTAEFLRDKGYKIKFIVPSGLKGSHTPDIKMCGKYWEIKAIFGKGRHTIEKMLKHASKQSKNIIVDTRNTKLSDTLIIRILKYEVSKRKEIKELKIITKDEKIMTVL